MPPIPLIDITDLAGDNFTQRAQVARQVGQACRDTGFFAITGHGVGAPQVADAFAAAREVFALPLATKQAMAIRTQGHNRGYVALGIESLNEHAPPDLKEAFNLIWTQDGQRPPNVWPPLPGWPTRAQAYFDAVLAVGRRLHRAFAIDLGIAEHFFEDKLDAPQATLRFLHYPATFDSEAPVGQAGAGTHTDYGNVTLLATDAVAGLQVQRRGGGWLDVPHLPGAFICNIGDCLMRWSNDVYVSTPHRVRPPTHERYSIAFFLDPNPEAYVSALPTCVPPGQAPRHPPVTAAEHLRQRLSATYKFTA